MKWMDPKLYELMKREFPAPLGMVYGEILDAHRRSQYGRTASFRSLQVLYAAWIAVRKRTAIIAEFLLCGRRVRLRHRM